MTRIKQWVKGIAIVLLWSVAVAIPRQAGESSPSTPTDSIYLVKASSCPFIPDRISTGFTVSDINGIVTTLHGVAGCTNLEAVRGDTRITPLRVSEVDIRNDIAVLSSSSFSTTPSLARDINRTLKPREKIDVIGHPEGIEVLSTPVQLGKPPSSRLSALLPRALLPKFQFRRSPDPAIAVLVVRGGTLVPGYSGAPLIDEEERVIGIMDGGLDGGLSQISWAIPLRSVHLVPKVEDSSWQRVVGQDPSGLMSFSSDLPPIFPIRSSQVDTGAETIGADRHMSTDITISSNGSIDAVTRIRNDVWFSGFCGKVALWLSDKDGNILYHSNETSGDGWCVTARALGRNERSTTWHLNIKLPDLTRVRGVSILQTAGSRNPFEYIRDNLSRAQKIRKLPPVK